MSQILKRAEKIVVPSERSQKQKDAIVEQVIKLVQKQVTDYPQITGIEVVGSYAKGLGFRRKQT